MAVHKRTPRMCRDALVALLVTRLSFAWSMIPDLTSSGHLVARAQYREETQARSSQLSRHGVYSRS